MFELLILGTGVATILWVCSGMGALGRKYLAKCEKAIFWGRGSWWQRAYVRLATRVLPEEPYFTTTSKEGRDRHHCSQADWPYRPRQPSRLREHGTSTRWPCSHVRMVDRSPEVYDWEKDQP